MRARVLVAALLTVALLAAASPVDAHWPGKSDRTPASPVYVALGDSVPAGFGLDSPDDESYVGLLHDLLRTDLDCSPARAPRAADGCKHLGLVNLADSGATSTSLITGQLPAAMALLAERNGDANPRNDVEVVTVTIGGNDLIDAVLDDCGLPPDPATCVPVILAAIATYAANLPQILAGLRQAGGTDVTIVTTAYYNPLPACFAAPFAPLADVVLEGGTIPGVITLPAGFNDITRTISAAYGADVANAYGALGIGDFIGGQDCLHPDASGHEALAAIFDATITGA